MSKWLMGLALVVAASPASAWFWGNDNPVRKAINEGSFELTLADYKAGEVEDREELILALMADQSLSQTDLSFYVNCMGDYAGSKSEELMFAAVFKWCSGDAKNDRAAFEAHFNELDAKDLSFDASTMCQQLIKRQLTSPATADFGGWRRAGQGQWRYLSAGHVDAQNAFGAVVRASFTCDLQYGGLDEFGEYLKMSNWTIHDVAISQ